MTTTQAQRLTPDSIVSASREQISSELAGEIVILNLNAGVYHGLDATGREKSGNSFSNREQSPTFIRR